MRLAYLKPTNPDVIVRDPDHLDPNTSAPRALRAEGELKEMTVYWKRRIREGSVIETSAPHNEKNATPAAPKVTAKPSKKSH